LSDGVVALRYFDLHDIDAVTEACQDPEISKWTVTVPSPYTSQHARSWISTHDEQRRVGASCSYAVCSAIDGRLFGSLGLNHFDWNTLTSVAGYWIAAPERGRGAATRALRLGARWVFDEVGLKQLELMTLIGNLASERVAEGAGFHCVAEIEDHRIPASPERVLHVKMWRRTWHDD
jgi:RimJ/RimL family protein N-acetyltransferase